MNHLRNALRKCSHQYRRTWAGYLVPKEILALRDAGVDCSSYDVDVAIDWKRNGVNNGRWFYFKTNKKFEEVKKTHG